MSQSLSIGPLTFPYALLLVLGALWLGLFVGRRLARRTGLDAEPVLWRMLLVGLVAARLAFVVQFREAYSLAPLDMLDIRDGGWTPWAGFVAAGLYGAFVVWRKRPLLRPTLAAIVTTSATWLIGTALLAAADEAKPLPAVALPTLDGQVVALSAFAGKPVVVNLWATWCPPCRREMPVLLQAQAERGDVHFVFVNQGEPADKVRGYLAAHRLALRNVLLDEHGQVAAQLAQRALPTTLFFDAKGRLADVRVGELSRATLLQRLAVISP